jgi:hypothetical protein
MARYYQVSLRTMLEVFFVIAVALAFVYWRNQPSPEPSGRYQFITTNPGDGQRGLFLDTKTGKAWRGWLNNGPWEQVTTPVDNLAAAAAPPSAAAKSSAAAPPTPKP